MSRLRAITSDPLFPVALFFYLIPAAVIAGTLFLFEVVRPAVEAVLL